MNGRKADIGIIGLGVMGRNLLLNMADHGFAVTGYDRDPDKVAALSDEGSGRAVAAEGELATFLERLAIPRAIMLLVPAGKAVDAVIEEILPHLEAGDLIIDGGNSHFEETERRYRDLAQQGLFFLGVGISGGESGARHGPSLMPGGAREAYPRVQRLFEAVAAKVDAQPCVTWLGPGSAGHYVKMVHNGIEYGLMQLLAESYDLMKRGLGFGNRRLQDVFREWNRGPLDSFLLEITVDIFGQVDDRTGRDRIDVILDAAHQKGTGMWAAQNAMTLHVPTPVIDLAVMQRDLSGDKEEREAIARVLGDENPDGVESPPEMLGTLENALYGAVLLTYVQGLGLLQRVSQLHDYALDLAEVARIWRGGCIIRAAVLETLRGICRRSGGLPHLLCDPELAETIRECGQDLRLVVAFAVQRGLPVPALMASLAYLDGYRSAWLPANLIQAQRDYFGAHSYERIDMEGSFHTHWKRD